VQNIASVRAWQAPMTEKSNVPDKRLVAAILIY
jgi:hypothetical protein